MFVCPSAPIHCPSSYCQEFQFLMMNSYSQSDATRCLKGGALQPNATKPLLKADGCAIRCAYVHPLHILLCWGQQTSLALGTLTDSGSRARRIIHLFTLDTIAIIFALRIIEGCASTWMEMHHSTVVGFIYLLNALRPLRQMMQRFAKHWCQLLRDNWW